MDRKSFKPLTMSKIPNGERFCVLCGESAKIKNIRHRNEDMPDYFQFHSECLKEKFINDDYNPIDTLRMMNIPYVHEVWVSAVENTEKNDLERQEAITKYLKMIGPKKQYKDFMDSVFEPEEDSVTAELESRWGAGLTPEEYRVFENSYQNLVHLQPPKNLQDVNSYTITVRMEHLLKEALRNGDHKEIKDLQMSYDKQLKSIGLDSISLKDSSMEKSLGEKIQEWEQNGPLPEIEEDFKDIDNIKKYFDTFFLYPLLRNFDKYNEKMEKLLDNFSKTDLPKKKGK